MLSCIRNQTSQKYPTMFMASGFPGHFLLEKEVMVSEALRSKNRNKD